jgi:hypothetical protein
MTEALVFRNYCFLLAYDFPVLLKPSLIDPYKHSAEAKEVFLIHDHPPSSHHAHHSILLISIRKTIRIFAQGT